MYIFLLRTFNRKSICNACYTVKQQFFLLFSFFSFFSSFFIDSDDDGVSYRSYDNGNFCFIFI